MEMTFWQWVSMKALKLWIAIAGVVGTSLLSSEVSPDQTAFADDACYMITSSGKRVSLGKLCAGSTPQPGAKSFFQARIKRREGGTPVIDVVLNGQTHEMLVDTGASGSVITRTMAQSLQLPIVGMGRFTLADGRTIMMPIGQVSSLAVDGATIRNVNVAIAENAAESLLGSDFLGNYDVKIRRDVIELYPR